MYESSSVFLHKNKTLCIKRIKVEHFGNCARGRASDFRRRNGDLEPGLSIVGLALGALRAEALKLEQID